MKLRYYLETDSLYIDLSGKTSVESREVREAWCSTSTSKARW